MDENVPIKEDNKVEDTVDLYNVNDGIHGRQGGPYLDQVEQANFERMQAAREGKEPDYGNPRPYPGIKLVTKAALVQSFNETLSDVDAMRDHSEVQVTPLVRDVPVVNSNLAGLSEDQGEVVGPVAGDPEKDNVSTYAIPED